MCKFVKYPSTPRAVKPKFKSLPDFHFIAVGILITLVFCPFAADVFVASIFATSVFIACPSPLARAGCGIMFRKKNFQI